MVNLYMHSAKGVQPACEKESELKEIYHLHIKNLSQIQELFRGTGLTKLENQLQTNFILVFRSTKPCLATRRVSPTRVPRGILNAASTRDQPAPSILGCGECT